jgi:hypothetical protein
LAAAVAARQLTDDKADSKACLQQGQATFLLAGLRGCTSRLRPARPAASQLHRVLTWQMQRMQRLQWHRRCPGQHCTAHTKHPVLQPRCAQGGLQQGSSVLGVKQGGCSSWWAPLLPCPAWRHLSTYLMTCSRW